MDRRVVSVVVLVAAVALAGCTAGFGPSSADGGSGDTGTGDGSTGAGDGQAIQTAESSIETFSYPDGASPTGIADTEALLSEHEAALSGESVTLSGTTNFSFQTGAGGEEGVTLGYEVRHDAEAGATLSTLREPGNGTLTVYSTGETVYFRRTEDGETEYGTAAPNATLREDGPESYTGRSLLRTMIGQGNFTATEVIARNGTELVRYEMTSLVANPVFNIGGDRTEFDGVLLVDAEGAVHEADVSVAVLDDEGTAIYRYDADVRLTGIGSTTVEEPDWTNEAR